LTNVGFGCPYPGELPIWALAVVTELFNDLKKKLGRELGDNRAGHGGRARWAGWFSCNGDL